MTKAKDKRQPESVIVHYDLHELPTAQHRAGLAGLLLQIDNMKERKDAGALPSDLELPMVSDLESTNVKITFTERAVINLFNDLYDAEVVKKLPRKKKQDREPKRSIEKEKTYLGDTVQPLGHFFRRYTDDGKECWYFLWRDMVISIPRNQDATMGPFKDMAQLRLARSGEAEWERMVITRREKDSKCYLHCREGIGAWEGLLRFEKEQGKGHATTGLSGALLIGTQDKNAECIPFVDRVDHSLLLHFWTLTARIFIPEMIDPDGQRKSVGFVLAFPDVRDLPAFCRAYVRLLSELKPELRGYRPAEAVISIPAQGALEFMHHLADFAQRTVIQEGPARFIASVEFFHLVRIGQNVKMAANGRIPPRDVLLQLYAGIRANYHNPVFQSSYLLSAIRGKPWFAEFEDPMTEREWSFFVHSTQEKHRTPPAMIGFAWEAHRRFHQVDTNYRISKEDGMAATGTVPDEVDRIVYQMIGRYAHFRTLARLRFEADDPKQPWMREEKDKHGEIKKRETPEYQEERRKVCSSLYLELRSRNAEDFVEYFGNALSAVANYLPEGDFATIAAALMRSHTNDMSENRLRTRDDVKTLTLLALSAHSRSLFARADAESDETSTKETES